MGTADKNEKSNTSGGHSSARSAHYQLNNRQSSQELTKKFFGDEFCKNVRDEPKQKAVTRLRIKDVILPQARKLN